MSLPRSGQPGRVFWGYIVEAALCDRPDNEEHPRRGAPTVGNIMDWFKTMTTNACINGVKQHGRPPFHGKLWQRNYYEHVIRGGDLRDVREYIVLNPAGWTDEEENPALTGTTPAK